MVLSIIFMHLFFSLPSLLQNGKVALRRDNELQAGDVERVMVVAVVLMVLVMGTPDCKTPKS